MAQQYKLSDDEFVAVLRAKLSTRGGMARPILSLFHEPDGSIARGRTMEWFGSMISDQERAELLETEN